MTCTGLGLLTGIIKWRQVGDNKETDLVKPLRNVCFSPYRTYSICDSDWTRRVSMSDLVKQGPTQMDWVSIVR